MTVITNTIIEIRNLDYQYPQTNRKILRGIDFEVYENEIVAIVGRLGSGKSTLLRHINGLIEIQSGDILIEKMSIKGKYEEYTRKIGFLFENPDDQLFYPVVADDIAFGPRNLKLDKQEVHKRVIDAATQVRIRHLLERDTFTLSFGEKSLVAIAGILAMKPKIILMDSPTFGLDFWTRPRILKLIQTLSKDHTIIIATNNDDILRISDRILMIHRGQIRGRYKSYATFRSAMTRKEKADKKKKPTIDTD